MATETKTPLEISAIMLGVQDIARSKEFYEQLGASIEKDYPQFVSLRLAGGPSLALYPRDAAASDAGVSSQGSGFRGVSLHFIVAAHDTVDQVIARAAQAGGAIVRKPEATQWGYFGYFSDPDGYLWKIAWASY